MNPQLKFGTSGLRGPVAALNATACYHYASAFLTHLDTIGEMPSSLWLGIDLRPSSPSIASAVAAAAIDFGLHLRYAGAIPTPALALVAFAAREPAIMITGSHNPAGQNGLKFFLPGSELRKEDEAPIEEIVASLKGTARLQNLPEADPTPRDRYVERYLSIFPNRPFKGLKLGIDLHSAVGGPLLAEIFEQLGAECFPYGQSVKFIAVDTEALATDRLKAARDQIRRHKLDAVVSTDGDGDRPLLIDAEGLQIGGDVLGLMAASWLGYPAVVTPVSSTTVIEKSAQFKTIRRTAIGSPFVIAAMLELLADGRQAVAGFEANGGFLAGGDLNWRGTPIPPLMTRDAVLPLVAVLARAKEAQLSLATLVQQLPQRVMLSGRLETYSRSRANGLLADLRSSEAMRIAFLAELAHLQTIDETDGLRMTNQDGLIIHLRPSGNAEELRCYIEAGERAIAANLLNRALKAAENYFPKTDS